MRSLSCWAVLTSSNAGLTSSGGRALGRLSSVTNRPVREASSEACSIFRADTASASRAPSTVSRLERPTCSRTVDSAACCSIWSASRVPNRYFCASPTLYCTLISTWTMFSSAVRIGTLSLKVLIWVAATLVTRSTGHGSLKCGPGSRIRANWPKRSTTPRSCSATSTKQLKASHSTSARPTQRSGLPPPPSNMPRKLSNRPPRPPPLPRRGFHGLRRSFPDPPSSFLPGMFQAMPAPIGGVARQPGRPRRSEDRKSGVKGKGVSGRVDLGGRRLIKKKKKKRDHNNYIVSSNRKRKHKQKYNEKLLMNCLARMTCYIHELTNLLE